MKPTAVIIASALVLAGAGGVWLARAGAHRDAQPTRVIPTKLVDVSYDIGGMHCDGCAAAITAEVLEVPGVITVVCSFDSKKAQIQMATDDLRPSVEHAITKLGYTLTPTADSAK